MLYYTHMYDHDRQFVICGAILLAQQVLDIEQQWAFEICHLLLDICHISYKCLLYLCMDAMLPLKFGQSFSTVLSLYK